MSFFLKILFTLSLVSINENTFAEHCPETLLRDFSVKVKSKNKAMIIFKKYFTTEKGFPAFDPKKVKEDASPSCKGFPRAKCFYYDNWYGMGASGVGGYLYQDGRLVKRGYCK